MAYRILTICTGNICRSPMAEYALREAVAQRPDLGEVEVESAGTTGYEVGNPVDPRAGALLRREGIDASAHRAQAVTREQLEGADLVLALDHDHVKPLQRLGGTRMADTLHMMRDFDPEAGEDTGIRDPWYGDESDFELAWSQITVAVPGILDHVAQTRRGREAEQ